MTTLADRQSVTASSSRVRPPTPWHHRLPRGPQWSRSYRVRLAALCLFSAGMSVLLRLVLFRNGSLDDDEVAYLLQAKAIAAGHLLVPAPSPADAYQPWFFAIGDGGYISKYLPGVPLLLAASLRLTGRVWPVLALLSACVPVLVAALARALGFSRRRALVAAALVSLSPLLIVQSALVLSYVPFLVLLLLCWLLLAQMRPDRPAGALAWRGLLLGLSAVAAATARPLDSLLLLSVPALVVAWQLRGVPLRLAVAAVSVLVGAAPLLAGIAVYDARVTGSALRLPFGLLEPQDKLGFGRRKLYPEDLGHVFGINDGLYGLLVHFVVGPMSWFALGVLVLPAAALGVRRLRGRPLAPLLGGVALLLVAYTCFWGPWNASVGWGGPFTVGPFYALAVEVPLVLAALPVLARLQTRNVRPVAALIAAAALLNALQLEEAVRHALHQADRTRQVLAVADLDAPGRLLLDEDLPYLGHPVASLVNTIARPDRIALAAKLPVPHDVQGLRLLQLPGDPYGKHGLSYALSHVVRSVGPTVTLDVARSPGSGRPPASASAGNLLVVERGGKRKACVTRPHGQEQFTVTPESFTGCSGGLVPRNWVKKEQQARSCPGVDCLSIGVYRLGTDDKLSLVAYRRLPVATTPFGVALLTDGTEIASAGQGWLVVHAVG